MYCFIPGEFPPMRFAICNETFQDWPFEKACVYASELGYTGLEIAPFTIHYDARKIDAATRKSLREAATNAGLEVIGLHWLLAKTEGLHLTSPKEEVRQRTADYLIELARLCRDLGGHVLVFGSPQQRNLLPGVDLATATDYAVDVIECAVPTLEETGITLALEPLGPAEGDFWLTAGETIKTIERIASPQVRLHLDVKAMSSEPKPVVDVIREGAEHLAHFHANDPNKRGPGMGAVDFVPIFETLKAIKYDGWVSVEVFDYEPGIETLATESIRYMRECLEKTA